MYDIILAIQYISILGLFIESIIVFTKRKNKLHSYLFLSCIATLVNNIGYILGLQAQTEEAYMESRQFAYAGGVWIGLLLFLFVTEITRKRIPQAVKAVLVSVHAAIYAVILTAKNHDLYYINTNFAMNGNFPMYTHNDGIIRQVFTAFMIFFIVTGMSMLIFSYFRENSKKVKNQILMVFLAVFSESVFFIIQMFNLTKLTVVYDFTMIGFSLGTLFMFVAIFRFELLSTSDLAKDFMLDKLLEPIIAVDNYDTVQYFNEPAKKLYPGLKLFSKSLPAEIPAATDSDGSVTVDECIYKPKKNELTQGAENFGCLYVLVDETEHHKIQSGLRREVGRQTERADRLSFEMMIALSKTVDAKDHYTNGHSTRVAEYAAEITRRMGRDLSEQEKIYEMGLMHDIGKIGVSEEIINKTSRLTDEEFEQIKKHTVIGHGILSSITEMPDLATGARSHHERYDGRGYPDGLAGKDIPEAARIICVADCYDAMTSTRTYSKPRPQEAVRSEIVRCSGTQFDPDIAAIMLQMIDDDADYKMNEQGGARVWKNNDRNF